MRSWAVVGALVAAMLVPSVEARPIASGGSSVPIAAQLAGYTTKTFHTGSFSTANVDMAQGFASGKQ